MHKVYFSSTLALSKYSSDTSELFQPTSNQIIVENSFPSAPHFSLILIYLRGFFFIYIWNQQELADALFCIFVSVQLI